MKKIVLIAMALLVNGVVLAQSPFIGPKDLQLYVDGKPFFVRGMVYAPEPRGFANDPNDANGGAYAGNWLSMTLTNPNGGGYYFKGAWICSPVEQYAKGDYKSPCWDDDLAGVLTGQDSWGENAKYNSVLQSKWKADLDAMQNLGVNTLRLYNVNSTGKSHTAFLQAATDHKMHVLFPVLTDYSANIDPNYLNAVTALVKETCPGGNLNPAILAYVVGNELTPIQNTQQKNRIIQSIDLIKKECPKALVTYAHNDVPTEWAIGSDGKSPLMEALGNKLDFFTINEYRNDDNGGISAYHDFFTKAILPFTKAYTKPVLIGETGEHQNNHFQLNWFNQEWKYILENSRANGNLGAVFFEYNDEPIKKFHNDKKEMNSNDAFMGIVTADWPALKDKGDFVDVPDIKKTQSYNGIPVFTDKDGTKVDFGALSKKGAGRYEMFDNDGKGIAGCSYKWSPDPDSISDECKKAK